MRNFFRTLSALSAGALLWLNTTAQVTISVTEMAAMPEAVSNNAVCEGYVNGTPYVYSFSGIDSSRDHDGIHLKSWRYSTATDAWEAISDLPDTLGKVAASASRVGDVIYIIGGYHVATNGNEYTSSRVHRYNTQTNSYLSDGADTPTPVDDHVQVVWRDSIIICITGWSGNGPSGTNVPDVQLYNPATDTWQAGNPVPNNNSYKVFGAAGTIVGDTIYYFGGARLGGNFPASTSFVKGAINPADPTDITWEQMISDPVATGYRTAATQRYGEAYWLGGSAITYNYDGLAYSNNQPVPPAEMVLHYSSHTGTWDTSTVVLPMDLRGLAHTGVNTRYIAGGMLAGPTVSDKTWKVEFADVSAVAEPAREDVLRVYPVPAREVLQVELRGMKTTSVRLLGMSGAVMKQTTSNRVDVSQLPAGMYVLEARTTTGTHRQLVAVD